MDIPEVEEPNQQPAQEPDEPPKEPRRLAKQDQRLINEVRTARAMILKLSELPDAAELMAGHGYGGAKLDEGMAQYQAALDAITHRSDSISHKQISSAALNGADLTAREVYADFKTVTKPFFRARGDRTALAVSGKTPQDRDNFIVMARDAFGSGREQPYSETLEIIGFGAGVMSAAEVTLDNLEKADAAHKASIDAAIIATHTRDELAAELSDWIKKFEGVLKVVLKRHPSLATILKPPLPGA